MSCVENPFAISKNIQNKLKVHMQNLLSALNLARLAPQLSQPPGKGAEDLTRCRHSLQLPASSPIKNTSIIDFCPYINIQHKGTVS